MTECASRPERVYSRWSREKVLVTSRLLPSSQRDDQERKRAEGCSERVGIVHVRVGLSTVKVDDQRLCERSCPMQLQRGYTITSIRRGRQVQSAWTPALRVGEMWVECDFQESTDLGGNLERLADALITPLSRVAQCCLGVRPK